MLGFFVILGLIVGSFLNVVIARLPEGRSLWGPRSMCPGCGAAIAWYDNVPVLSFVALRGHCRHCAMPISWQYPTTEAATALLFGVAYVTFGVTLDLLVGLVLLGTLVAITGIDLQRQLIPDLITLPGIVVGFLASLVTGRISWLDSLLGVLIGGGLFFVIIVASGGGMGGGDMKLGAMLGAFLGWKVVLLATFIAVVVGGGLAIGLMAAKLRGRKDAIPFGPFLAAGGAIGLLWGERILRWYLAGFIA
jgi:leader peptidase (prepilin peptidase) / N-methyltransferase